ncbi:MAG: tRNA lysidine(34) synthetase TilS [Chloroflexota bacterium]|nr:tRNA lysidine(34) synthetase TilS [Chloroflexota bacterium]
MNDAHRGGPSPERRLLDSVERTLTRLLPGLATRRIVAAVSGGPDSMALLLLLDRLRETLDFDLHVAHADHSLRGEEAREDARFVEDAAQDLGLPVTLGRLDVNALRAGRRMSLEEAAREARYAFLVETASTIGASAIAVGHTTDDQVETVLMHLIRGSGASGLAGMPAISHLQAACSGEGVALVRPLLDFTKAETRAYCMLRGVTPREDSSNSSLEITRNRVRLELVPTLERYNPRIRQALLRMSSSAAHDLDFLEQAAGDALRRLEVAAEHDITVSRAGFGELHPAVQRHLLRLAYRELAGAAKELTHRHVEDMVRLSSGRTGAKLELPGGIRFEVGYDTLRLAPVGAEFPAVPPIEGEYEISVPGETCIGAWCVRAELLPPVRDSAAVGSHQAVLDADRAGRRLCVRSRRPGDRIAPLGMTGTRKVQDVMVDEKIPAAERDGVPLVASENGVVWVVGHRMAHWARVREDTERVLRLDFRPVDAR